VFLAIVFVGGGWAVISGSRREAAARREERARVAAAAKPAPAPARNVAYFANGKFPVSPDRSLVERMVRYVRENDAAAMYQLVADNSRRFTTLEKGAALHIVDWTMFSGLVKVRAHGDATEYWAPRVEIEERKQ